MLHQGQKVFHHLHRCPAISPSRTPEPSGAESGLLKKATRPFINSGPIVGKAGISPRPLETMLRTDSHPNGLRHRRSADRNLRSVPGRDRPDMIARKLRVLIEQPPPEGQ